MKPPGKSDDKDISREWYFSEDSFAAVVPLSAARASALYKIEKRALRLSRIDNVFPIEAPGPRSRRISALLGCEQVAANAASVQARIEPIAADMTRTYINGTSIAQFSAPVCQYDTGPWGEHKTGL